MGSAAFAVVGRRFAEIYTAHEAALVGALDAADAEIMRAGSYDDLAARAESELAAIDNASFEVLSKFEEQRRVASDSWAALDGTEQRLDDERQQAQDLRVRAESARRAAKPEAERLETRLKELEAAIVVTAREVDAARERLSNDEQRKHELWVKEEEIWWSAFSATLARAEYHYLARRARARAKDLFANKSPHRQSTRSVAELAHELGQLREEARLSFGCALVEEFCYWPRRDDARGAFCVPLVAAPAHLNIQLTSRTIYVVEQTRGLDFVEPLPPKQEGHDDPRLADFFLTGRATAPQARI
jgi:hypothetical protein